MSEINKLFKQSSHYALGQILLLIASLISFPILTRIFSVSDYGILSLITTAIFIIIPITKLGIHHSSIRHYEEFKTKTRRESISHFYSTLFFGSLVLTIGTITLFWLILKLIPSKLINPAISSFLIFVATFVFLRSTQGILMVFLRAEQKSISYTTIQIVQRYGSFILGLLFLFFILKSLHGYFIGMVVADLSILLFLLYNFFEKAHIHWKYMSINFLKESIKYGLPLVAVETMALLIAFTDRYLIQFLLGLEPLGIYSACNNMIMYVSHILNVPMNLALLPICTSIWVRKGRQETKEFLSKAFRYFCLIAFPITLGFISIGREVLILLASEKYIEASSIISYIMMGKIFFASSIIFAIGIHLCKKTWILAILFLLSWILNTILNILMIPSFGIVGAAYSILITYIALFMFILSFSFRYLKFRIDCAHIALCSFSSVVMYIFIKNIGSINYLLLDIVFKIFLGTIIYSTLILLFDKTMRSYSKKYLIRFQVKALKYLNI